MSNRLPLKLTEYLDHIEKEKNEIALLKNGQQMEPGVKQTTREEFNAVSRG